MRQERRLITDLGAQALGNYVSVGLRVVRGFVVAGILGPAQMGVVATGNLILNYGQYTDLGVTQAAARQVPMSLSRGESQEAAAWEWYAFLAQIVSGVLTAGVLALWLVSPTSASQPSSLRWVIAIVGVTSIVSGMLLALQTLAKARQRFVVSSRILVLFAGANLVAGVLGARFGGAVGVVVGVFVASAIACVYGWLALAPTGYAGIQWAKMRELLVLGLPLALLTFVGFNLENIDQVMILWLLDRTQLGLYSIVLQAGGLLTLAGLSVSNVVGPRLLAAYAKDPTVDAIRDHTWRPALALSALVPVLVCGAWLVGPLLIAWLLPRFTDAIPAFRIYLVAMYFLSVNLGTSTALLALRKHGRTLPIMVSCIALNVALDLVLVGAMGLGIEGIALASLITYATYWLTNSTLIRWYFERDVARSLILNLRLAWPGIALAAFLALSVTWGGLSGANLLRDTLFVVAACVIGLAQGGDAARYLWSGARRSHE